MYKTLTIKDTETSKRACQGKHVVAVTGVNEDDKNELTPSVNSVTVVLGQWHICGAMTQMSLERAQTLTQR